MRYLFLPFIAFYLITACSPTGVNEEEIKSLSEAKTHWQSQKPDNYRFHYQELCYCGFTEKVEVVVEGDSVIAVLDISSGEPFIVSSEGDEVPVIELYPNLFPTIDSLFENFEQRLISADEVQISYNEKLGYPTRAYFDMITNAVDDEVTFIVENLRAN